MIGCEYTCLRSLHHLISQQVAGKVACHAALGIFMLSINRLRDRKFHLNKDFVDEESKRRDAEARGMLDQTEVSPLQSMPCFIL